MPFASVQILPIELSATFAGSPPPLRLLVVCESVEGVRAKNQAVERELRTWSALALSTDFAQAA